MKDHDEIFAKILKKIDQRFMSGGAKEAISKFKKTVIKEEKAY